MTRSVGSSSTMSTRVTMPIPFPGPLGGESGWASILSPNDRRRFYLKQPLFWAIFCPGGWAFFGLTKGRTQAGPLLFFHGPVRGRERKVRDRASSPRSIEFVANTFVVGSKPFAAILCFLPVLLNVGDVEHDTFESDWYTVQVIHADEINEAKEFRHPSSPCGIRRHSACWFEIALNKIP